MKAVNRLQKRRFIIICLMMLIAIAHLLNIGAYIEGTSYIFYASFFSDIFLTFGAYFLLCAAEITIPYLRPWAIKGFIAFIIPSIAEICQYFGIPVLGVTFDQLDYIMYAIGALSAIFVDRLVFTRFFAFWAIEK
ncbi:MAG: hypothetical protein JEZ00_06885 [Anaerolineaceae bacterium]|nr:hypothetical protein [Anaerolineaceae bacterium]